MLNQFKTVMLLAGMSALLFVMGRAIGGNAGAMLAFGIALVMNLVTYFFSDKIVLRMYGAVPLDRSRYGWLYETVQELCTTAGLPMPTLWYVNTPMANAFATGRNPQHAAVAVTQGILDLLDRDELRGVLAHEISHIKNRDILVGTVAATLATAIAYVADMGRWALFWGSSRRDEQRGGVLGAVLLIIFMPLVAILLQLAVSRSREYLADESGADCCQDPLALASALEKLHMGVRQQHAAPRSTAEAAVASLFIVYPFSVSGIAQLFSTHPPMEQRVKRLQAMARKMR